VVKTILYKRTIALGTSIDIRKDFSRSPGVRVCARKSQWSALLAALSRRSMLHWVDCLARTMHCRCRREHRGGTQSSKLLARDMRSAFRHCTTDDWTSVASPHRGLLILYIFIRINCSLKNKKLKNEGKRDTQRVKEHNVSNAY